MTGLCVKLTLKSVTKLRNENQQQLIAEVKAVMLQTQVESCFSLSKVDGS